MKLFLDDIRSPRDCAAYMHKRIGSLNPIYTEGGWFIVRNFEEFKEAIFKYQKDITHISFDHDLADGHYHESMDHGAAEYEKHLASVNEKTGYDCAMWMIDFYNDNNYSQPVLFVHSMNPVGVQRIISAFGIKK